MSEEKQESSEPNSTASNVDKPRMSVSTIIDDDKNTKLHYAAATGDQAAMVEELKNGQKVDAENYLGWTPLMMAARNGHEEIIKLLVTEYRADATKRNKFGQSIFLISITSGKLEIVRFLLQHLLCGGISRQSIQKVFSPISISILFNHADILKYLIEMSFDIDHATSVTGITPMMIAAAMELKDLQAILLESGADPSIKNILGHTAEIQTKKRKPKRKQSDNLCLPQMPMFLLSPQPFFHYPSPIPTNGNNPIRKSSNTLSPNYAPPNITPIAPMGFYPQYFFPPDFSPNHPFFQMSPMAAMSPVIPNMLNNSDMLNARIDQSVFSAHVPQQKYPTSPCA